MSQKIYINGKLLDREDAKISVYDHAVLYGDGIYEGIRSYGGKLFRLAAHIDRLWESAKVIWLEIPMSKEELTKAVEDTLAINGIQDGYVRLVVTRGSGPMGLDPHRCSNPQVIIIADNISLYPEEYYQKGLEIITSSVPRNHPAALNPRTKSLNYLNNIMAKIEGIQAGCPEALMLNQWGEVAECTGDNIFFVRHGKLLTPPVNACLLEGITRNVVIELAGEMGIEMCETPLSRHDAYIADECFVTGTAAEVVPVVRIDSRVIGDGKPGPVTRKLTERFHQRVRS